MPEQSSKPHLAARLEDAFDKLTVSWLRRRGWHPRIVGYPGYGSAGDDSSNTETGQDSGGQGGWVRVLGRVLLAPPLSERQPPDTRVDGPRAVRGWRRFFTSAVPDTAVEIEVGGRTHTVLTDRGGYIDVRLPADLEPGWHGITARCGRAPVRELRVRVVSAVSGLGLVSDIDDTVMVTLLPRPLIATWNSFVLRESARKPVPGMAELYAKVIARHPDILVLYLSTGAWNVAPTLTRFLAHHGYPEGPLLLTDWGPTNSGWFRSGREHKNAALRRLAEELPQIRWFLVGDNGQHDPEIYAEFAAAHRPAVAAIAIRELTPGEQVLSHGTTGPMEPAQQTRSATTTVGAPDGFQLAAKLQTAAPELL